MMKDEIRAAVLFLVRLIEKHQSVSKTKLNEFQLKLNELWLDKFKDHWFPENPTKGQAFRCIRFNEADRRDGTIEEACAAVGIRYADLLLPVELTLWVDPEEVAARFGEHKGSFVIIASFRDGNKENNIDSINVDELEARSLERAKQASFDLIRRKKYLAAKNGYHQLNKHMYHPHGTGTMNGNGFSPYGSLDGGYGPVVSSAAAAAYYGSPHAGAFYGGSPKYHHGGHHYGSSPPHHHHSLHHSNGQSPAQQLPPHSQSNGGGYHHQISPPNRNGGNSLSSTPYRGSGSGSPSLVGNGSNGAVGSKPFSGRGLNSAFSSAAMSFGSSPAPYQQPPGSDRYHWMNKSIVKA